ncbi:MAG: hypothetical protein SFX74_08615 [Fimbriimonadaceae bacterium]|nr:hypothetical protein [Fimbriimonadaceae bacterium]
MIDTLEILNGYRDPLPMSLLAELCQHPNLLVRCAALAGYGSYTTESARKKLLKHLANEEDELVWIDGMITLIEGWLDSAIEYATECTQQPWYRRRARDQYDGYRYDPSLGLRASLLCDNLLRLTVRTGESDAEGSGDGTDPEIFRDANLESWIVDSIAEYRRRAS